MRQESFKIAFQVVLPTFSSSSSSSSASALGDSMDQLSQRSSSDRTQFMSREDLDQEGSLDLDHDQYHYQDHQEKYGDQEQQYQALESPGDMDGGPQATRSLEYKVQDGETTGTLAKDKDFIYMDLNTFNGRVKHE